MVENVNVTAYVARTDRSRFYCTILCPRIRSTMCKNMVTFCPAASELEAKMYQVTLSVYRSRLKVKVTKKLNQICALMPILYVWSFKTASHVVCQEPWTHCCGKKNKNKKKKRQERRNFWTTSWRNCVMKDRSKKKMTYTNFVDFCMKFHMALVACESVQPLRRYTRSKFLHLALA